MMTARRSPKEPAACETRAAGFTNSSSEAVDAPFARLEWIASDRFDIQWHRHAGQSFQPKRLEDRRPDQMFDSERPAISTSRAKI
jgi:hypothetical protein